MAPGPSVEDLERALFAQLLEGRRRKVAMIVAGAAETLSCAYREGTDAMMKEALARVLAREDVVSFGDIDDWRHSEMARRRIAS